MSKDTQCLGVRVSYIVLHTLARRYLLWFIYDAFWSNKSEFNPNLQTILKHINLDYHIQDFLKDLSYIYCHISLHIGSYRTFDIISTLRLHSYFKKLDIIVTLGLHPITHSLIHNKHFIKTLDSCPNTLHNIRQLFVIYIIIHTYKHHVTFSMI